MTSNPKDQKLLQTALLAGVCLLESGAETYRVEDTVERMLACSGMEQVDVVSLLTGFYLSVTTPDGETFTAVRRIKKRVMRLDRVQAVNQISRDLTGGVISVEEAYQKIQEVRKGDRRVRFAGVYQCCMAAGFALMYGATGVESLVGGLASCASFPVDYLMRGKVNGSFMPNFLRSFCIVFLLGVIVHFFSWMRMDLMVIGSLIAFFPGTTFTNGIRDIMHDDLLTGAGNLLSAIVSAMALAVGTFFALYVTGGVQ